MAFITPLFLFAAGAAVLPLIFHLIRRFRARRVRFSSLLFLRATPKKLIKRRRLRDILLLLIRAAILGLLAFMFARPFLPRETLPVMLQEADTSTVILLDTSYSMGYGDRFDEARDAALDIIGEMGGADEAALVTFSDHAGQLSALTGDVTLLRGLVNDAASVDNRTTDLWQPIRLADELLEHAANDRRRIVMISDFQTGGWDTRTDNWRLDGDISFVPVRVGGGDIENAYIDQLVVDKRRDGDAETVQLRLQVRADGGDGGHEVSFVLDGGRIEGKTAPALAASQVHFQLDDVREGAYQGSVELGGDDLTVDNTRYVTFSVAPRPSILCVDGSPANPRSNARFLASCFDMADRTQFEFDTEPAERLSAAFLAGYDILFLANPPALTDRQLTAVSDFADGGGTVILSFGDRAEQEQTGRLVRALGIGESASRVDARRERPMPVFVNEMDVRHPVFSVFSASGAGDLARPRFNEYISVVPDTAAVVLARLDSGEPFLVERRTGAGKVLVMTSSFNTEWGDFPVNDIFLPFVYQLAKYAIAIPDGGESFTVGDQVSFSGDSGGRWDVRTPDGRIVRVDADETGAGWFRDTGLPGNYQAESGGRMRYFSVNVDVRESDLTAMDGEEVYAAVTGGMTGGGDVTAATADADVAVEDEQNQKLWRVVLLMIIGLFMLETFLANRKMSLTFGSNQ